MKERGARNRRERPHPFRPWFKGAEAARRYREIMGGLRLLERGRYGRFEIGYALPERLYWFSDPESDKGRFQGKWIVPHLFGPERTMWMSWHPLEVLTVWRDSRHFRGGKRILVGGLGLGVFQQLVEARYEEVWTIEASEEVARGVHPMMRAPNWRIVVGDAYKFHRIFRKGAFDAAYFDIWKDFPGVSYRPLHRTLNECGRLHGIPRVRCWAQDLAGMDLPSMVPKRRA